MRQGGRVESSLNPELLVPRLLGKLEELVGQGPSWLHGGHFLQLCCSFSLRCEPGPVAPTVPCSMLGLGEPAVNLSPPPEESASPDFAQGVRELALPGRDQNSKLFSQNLRWGQLGNRKKEWPGKGHRKAGTRALNYSQSWQLNST